MRKRFLINCSRLDVWKRTRKGRFMQKKIVTMLLVLSMAALVGCGKDKAEDAATKDNQTMIENTAEENVEMSDVPEIEGSTEIGETPLEEDVVIDDATLEGGESTANQSSGKENNKTEQSTGKDHASTDTTSKDNDVSGDTKVEDDKTTNTEKNEEKDTQVKDPAVEKLDYESFQKLSPADQQAYMEKFDNVEAFFVWYNEAKEAYEKEHPSIEIGGDGKVDLDKILGGD